MFSYSGTTYFVTAKTISAAAERYASMRREVEPVFRLSWAHGQGLGQARTIPLNTGAHLGEISFRGRPQASAASSSRLRFQTNEHLGKPLGPDAGLDGGISLYPGLVPPADVGPCPSFRPDAQISHFRFSSP